MSTVISGQRCCVPFREARLGVTPECVLALVELAKHVDWTITHHPAHQLVDGAMGVCEFKSSHRVPSETLVKAGITNKNKRVVAR